MATTTLEELGWKPYWDSEGKYPVTQGENFNISPGETKSIFYHCNPEQEEDGLFYGNAFWILGDFPGVMGGIYSSELQKVDASIVADGFRGRVEEFALWDRPLNDGEIGNYHTNLTGMIGSTIGDKYDTLVDARTDGLTDYYQYGDTAVLQRFDGTQSLSLKNRSLPVGAGKNSNATIIEESDSIVVQSLVTASKFSLNIRFFIEENGDFVLVDIPETIKIEFIETNSLFRMTLFPPVGEAVIVDVEAVNLPNFKWHDFCVTYDGSTIKSYLTGELLESNSYSLGFMPKEAMSLDMTNIEWCSIRAARGLGIHIGGSMPSRAIVNESAHKTYYTRPLLNQKQNLNLFIDRRKGVRAASTFMKDRTSNPITVDSVSSEGSFYLDRFTYNFEGSTYYYRDAEYNFSLSSGGIEVAGVSTSTRSTSRFLPGPQNFFFPGMPIELIIKADPSFTEDFKGVPMVTLPYGCKILVEKTRIIPALLTPTAHANCDEEEVYKHAPVGGWASFRVLVNDNMPEGVESMFTYMIPRHSSTTKISEHIWTPYQVKPRDSHLQLALPHVSWSYTMAYGSSFAIASRQSTVKINFPKGSDFHVNSTNGRLHTSKIVFGPRLA